MASSCRDSPRLDPPPESSLCVCLCFQTAYTIPILAFAFVCHPEVLPIYTELREWVNTPAGTALLHCEKIEYLDFVISLFAPPVISARPRTGCRKWLTSPSWPCSSCTCSPRCSATSPSTVRLPGPHCSVTGRQGQERASPFLLHVYCCSEEP